MSQSAFVVRHLCQSYPPRRVVLHDVSFSVAAGELLAVVGAGGAGKTTLLRLLNALDEPAGGVVLLAGQDVRTWDVAELRRTVAMLPQTPRLFAGTVFDNLLTPLRLRHGRHAQPDDAWLALVLRCLGLGPEILSAAADGLSLAQQQRVCFARAMMLRPRVLLLDDPAAELEATAAGSLLRQFAAFARDQGLTAVLATARLDLARSVSDRVGWLERGSLAMLEPAVATAGQLAPIA